MRKTILLIRWNAKHTKYELLYLESKMKDNQYHLEEKGWKKGALSKHPFFWEDILKKNEDVLILTYKQSEKEWMEDFLGREFPIFSLKEFCEKIFDRDGLFEFAGYLKKCQISKQKSKIHEMKELYQYFLNNSDKLVEWYEEKMISDIQSFSSYSVVMENSQKIEGLVRKKIKPINVTSFESLKADVEQELDGMSETLTSVRFAKQNKLGIYKAVIKGHRAYLEERDVQDDVLGVEEIGLRLCSIQVAYYMMCPNAVDITR